jgi:hypothetical protein
MNSVLPVSPAPVTAGAIPWYKSPVVILQVSSALSAGVALMPHIAAKIGWTDPAKVNSDITAIFGVIALVAEAAAAIKRVTSKVQPITLTATAAANHPSTQAVVQTQAAMQAASIPTAAELQKSIAAGAKTP